MKLLEELKLFSDISYDRLYFQRNRVVNLNSYPKMLITEELEIKEMKEDLIHQIEIINDDICFIITEVGYNEISITCVGDLGYCYRGKISESNFYDLVILALSDELSLINVEKIMIK